MHNYQETSREAYESVDTEAIGERIIRLLKQERLTCDEIEERTGLLHQTASATLTALKNAGKIARTPEKRPTRTGRNAFVWGANPFA